MDTKLFENAENFRFWATKDRSDWLPGEWDGEPDKVQWIDPATGLDCLMHRGPSGHWCGYVGVAAGHPFHGKGYDEAIGECTEECTADWHIGHSPNYAVEVHGGLTFADACADTKDESRGICHVAAEGRPAHVWWFGFDCAHCDDDGPRTQRDERYGYGRNGVYRDLAYVKSEVDRLAAQIAKAAA